MTGRYLNTNDIGVAILNLCITKDLGWICRNTTNSDVGIDATVEQVVNYNPTAKYISIQLKTGFSNVYIDNNNNYTFYINDVHYLYWLSSSLPVILVLCDPDTHTLYWQLVKKQNISSTKSQHKIVIRKGHLLDKSSLEELNTIIDTYQAEFQIPEIDSEDINDIEYWAELLHACSEAISNSVIFFNQLDNKYKSHNNEMTRFIEKNQNGIEKSFANRQIKKYAKAFKLAVDICKIEFKNQIPIISKTHIEAIRLVEQALCQYSNLPDYIRDCIRTALNNEIKTIESTIEVFKIGAERYSNSSSPTFELRQSEHSFALILKDYVAELEYLVFWINKLNKSLCTFDDKD